MRTGHRAVVEQLVADGVTHMFGNPGTVEQGLLDALGDFPGVDYVLTLQETVAIMAADAHARATRGLAVAQIHSSPGLGNSIGALYQAKRGHSPILVLGGDAGIRYQAMDAQMAADLVAMAKPVTKWATMVQHPSSLLRVLRRAVKVALTPPMGPVYVCLPQDILDAEALEPVVASLTPSTRSAGDPALVAAAADALAKAARPTLYVGDGVAWSGAQGEVARIAELLGADVWGVDCGEVNLDTTHPLWRGQTGHMFGEQSLPILKRGDVNLIVGTYMVPEVFPELGTIFAPDAVGIHIDLDPDAIAKNHPVEIAMVADPKVTLSALADALEARLAPAARSAASARMEAAALAKRRDLAAAVAADDAKADRTPMPFSRFMRAFAEALPPGTPVFDEALTNSPTLTRYLPPTDPSAFFQTRGGSLGSALAGGVGLAAARPGRPVVAVSGDGGAMYTIQALWTAARHRLNVKYVICNNRSYRLLQLNIQQFWTEAAIDGRPFPLSFDLSKPALHFADLAKAMSVPAIRVETPADIAPAIAAALAEPGPFLLDVAIEGDVHPELIGVRCGQ
ncbi:thiamine pyrophosphate-binding protein [Mongoliimonas terrestris]|uniref:thiamine pyrophosphate-binding protein n=1 Tax=Mongoliimonas terrestris TaxID=1709001 RepID=UPI0009497D6C|nr:thiamine pyrophosphate-binding protein [Mongoliimonas terrestris]